MSKRVSLLEIEQANAAEAYERVLPEAMELARERVRVVNLDISKVVERAMAAAKRLPPFEARLRALPEFHVERLDCFADYTLALYSAYNRYRFPANTKEQLSALNKAAIPWRDVLLAEAKSLVARKRIEAALLEELSGYRGYRNVAHDIGGLAQIFKANWDQIQEHTGLKQAEIAEVAQLALRFTGALGMRKRMPKEIAAARDIQARVFTLLSRAYDDIRLAIQYLRGNRDDVDEFMPSLYSGRHRSKVAKDVAEDQVGTVMSRSTDASTAIAAPAQAKEVVSRGTVTIDGPSVPIELTRNPRTYN
jgi:hypothetical protein